MSGIKGRSGRKKTPLAVLKKRGARLDRRNSEPENMPVVVIEPTSMNDSMRCFYNAYLPILKKLGIIKITDSVGFERMASTYAKIRAIDELIGDGVDGLFSDETTKTDTIRRISASANLLIKLETLLWSQMREYGLTPSSRGSVCGDKKESYEDEKLT